MLLHLPPITDQGPRVKNGLALAAHGAEAIRDAIAQTIATLPERLRRSLTWDQGTEMAQHTPAAGSDRAGGLLLRSPAARGSAAPTRTPRGCCASISPREPISLATALRTLTDLTAVAATLNGRPRKTRGWRTPAEGLDQYLAAAA